MITIPRMNSSFLDAAKIYNSLHVADTTSVNYPMNYYLLSTEQRMFVDAIINACGDEFQQSVDSHNEDLEYTEEDLNEAFGEQVNDN